MRRFSQLHCRLHLFDYVDARQKFRIRASSANLVIYNSSRSCLWGEKICFVSPYPYKEEERRRRMSGHRCWSTVTPAPIHLHRSYCAARHDLDAPMLRLSAAPSPPTTRPTGERCRPHSPSFLCRRCLTYELLVASHRNPYPLVFVCRDSTPLHCRSPQTAVALSPALPRQARLARPCTALGCQVPRSCVRHLGRESPRRRLCSPR